MEMIMGFTEEAVQRVTESWTASHAATEVRIAEGKQPAFLQYGTSFGFLFGANAFYLLTCLVLSIWMKRREEPFKLKPVLLFYNASCVFLAGYVVYGMIRAKLSNPGRFACNPTDRTTEGGEYLAWVFWVFFAQKFWEFLDTFFFILRKSFRQVSFLHIFHHCSINLVVGLIVPHDYNGDMFLPIFLNAVVHVLMYSHYLVTALGIKSWWRQYLTSLQLLQFCAISVQSVYAYWSGSTCGSPDFAKVLMVAYMGSMLVLFGQFFMNAYVMKKDAKRGAVLKNVELRRQLITRAGTAILAEEGVTFIELPAGFPDGADAETSLNVNLTPIGRAMPELHVTEEATGGRFGVAGGFPGGRVCWQVSADVMVPAPKPKASTFWFNLC